MALSPKLSFHGCVQASSFVFLRAVRTWAAPSSKALISCAADSNGIGGILVFPKSSSGVVRIMRPKPASCATWGATGWLRPHNRSEEHTSELQSPDHLVCRLLLEKKKKKTQI